MNQKLPRTGHVSRHVPDTFIEATMPLVEWAGERPESVVPCEVNYGPHPISISWACALVWNCTDALSGDEYSYLRDMGLGMRKSTYAAAARALHADIKRLHREQDVSAAYTREARS